MYPNREVFARAPLALVAAEVRFSDLARLRQQETRDQITLALEGWFPFAQPLEQAQFNLSPNGPPQVQQVSGVVLRNAASTASVTVTSSFLTYETTAYSDFESLLDAVLAACDALLSTKSVPALQRIGLRYIDEIRVPEAPSVVREWRHWIDERIINLVDVGPASAIPTSSQGVTTYDLGENRGLNVRFAALNGTSVVGSHSLVRPEYPEGPLFVLDFDGYEVFSDGPATPLDRAVVGESLAAVHAPSGASFQRAITEQARRLFRGEES